MLHDAVTMSPAPAQDAGAVPRRNSGLDAGTLVSLLARNAKSHPKGIAMRERDRGVWREFTWSQMLAQVLAFAAWLDGEGFKPGEGLLVIGDNRPQLYFGMLSAGALRGLAAPPSIPIRRPTISRSMPATAEPALRWPRTRNRWTSSSSCAPAPACRR